MGGGAASSEEEASLTGVSGRKEVGERGGWSELRWQKWKKLAVSVMA